MDPKESEWAHRAKFFLQFPADAKAQDVRMLAHAVSHFYAQLATLRRDNQDMRESSCALWVRCPSCHRLHNQGWVCPGDCSEAAIDSAREGK